jgi:hypothetical protein
MLLLRRNAAARLGGYAIFAIGAACKFYPAALLVLAFREPRNIFWALAVLGLAAFLVFSAFFAPGAVAAIATIPTGTPFRATFGAIDLPRGLYLLDPIGALRHLVAAIAVLLSLLAIFTSYVLRRRYAAGLQALSAERLILLIAGAAVCTLCFYAAQNVCYRAVFLLFTLPGLAALSRQRCHMRILLAAILLLLWEAAFRAIFTSHEARLLFWLCRELLWWWVVIELGAILAAFLTSETPRLMSKMLQGRRKYALNA